MQKSTGMEGMERWKFMEWRWSAGLFSNLLSLCYLCYLCYLLLAPAISDFTQQEQIRAAMLHHASATSQFRRQRSQRSLFLSNKKSNNPWRAPRQSERFPKHLMKNSEIAASLRSYHVPDMLRSYPGLPEINVFGLPWGGPCGVIGVQVDAQNLWAALETRKDNKPWENMRNQKHPKASKSNVLNEFEQCSMWSNSNCAYGFWMFIPQL